MQAFAHTRASMLGKMNLKGQSPIAIATGIAVVATVALGALAVFPEGAQFLIEGAKFIATMIFVGLLMREKPFREFTIAVSVLFTCGEMAVLTLNQAALTVAAGLGIGAVLLGAVLVSERWKHAAFLAIRILLVTLLLAALVPLASNGDNLGITISIWILLAVFGIWRTLAGPPPQDKWSASRDADGTWRA